MPDLWDGRCLVLVAPTPGEPAPGIYQTPNLWGSPEGDTFRRAPARIQEVSACENVIQTSGTASRVRSCMDHSHEVESEHFDQLEMVDNGKTIGTASGPTAWIETPVDI